MEATKLPSLFQLNDYVSVQFPGTGILKRCRVIKVAFTEHTEPLYDVEVPFRVYTSQEYDQDIPEQPSQSYARIHGLKEWHLRNPMAPVADRLPLPENI